jgi:hypothetical protein
VSDSDDVWVLGRLRDCEVAGGFPGHRVLSREGWTLGGNVAHLAEIVDGERSVYLASPVRRETLCDEFGVLTMYGLELALLERSGYQRRGDHLVPPALDDFARALLADPVALYRDLRERGDLSLLRGTVEKLARLRPELAGEARALVEKRLPYADTLRFAARAIAAIDDDLRAGRDDLPTIYRPKVEAELEPLIALFPEVIVFPTFSRLLPDFFAATRAAPIHPLGMIPQPIFTDGALLSPREFFLHDVDHARFMVREDLRSRGVDLIDAYQVPDGGGPPTTLIDPATNLHRTILDHAAPLCREARFDDLALLARRADFGRSLHAAQAQLPSVTREAVALLLFEILHEKGFPIDPRALAAETAHPRHEEKLRHKRASNFYGGAIAISDATLAALPDARRFLAAYAEAA